MRTQSVLLALAALLLLTAAVAYANLNNLGDVAQADGGYMLNEQRASSADGTFKALYTSAIFGQKHQVDVEGAVQFLYTLKNADGGFGQFKGYDSDIFSTRDAVLGIIYSGATSVPNAESIVSFVQSLYNERSGLFASDAKSDADLVATAAAFRTLEALESLDASFAQKALKRIPEVLPKQGENGFFNVNSALAPIESNYYGVYLAKLAGVSFDAEKIGKIFGAHQITNGGFELPSSFGAKSDGIVAGTAFAAQTLSAIDQLSAIDAKKLRTFGFNHATMLPELEQQYSGAVALAHSGLLKEFFEDAFVTIFQAVSGPIREERVVIGTAIRTAARVHVHNAFDSSFEVDLAIQLPGQSAAEATVDRLGWNDDAMGYIGVNTQTLDKFGKYTYTFTAKKTLFGIGEITVTKTETKTVGYKLVLDPQVFTNGVAVKREGSEVDANTKYSFGLSIEDAEGPVKTFQPTTVEFIVLDPSGVKLASEEQQLDTENIRVEPFDFTLPVANIPGGYLNFIFRLSTEGVEGVHSERIARYYYPNALQATNIEFSGVGADEQPSFKIGDTVNLIFTPQIVDSNGELTPLASTIEDVEIVCNRKFLLNLATAAGDVFQTVESRCGAEQSDRYFFEFEVKPTFEFVAQPVLTFAFQPHEGAATEVSRGENNYVEEGQLFRLAVNSHAYVKKLTKTVTAKELQFGDDISFEFVLEDSVTGTTISAGNTTLANAYAELRHIPGEPKKPVGCGREAAVQGENGVFKIDWLVSANAIRGESEISLAIFAGDERVADLYRSADSDEAFSVRVTIKGEVQVDSKTYVTSDNLSDKSVFAVEFRLLSGSRVLKDASFRCDIARRSWGSSTDVALDVPVAAGDDSSYQVSLSSLHKNLPSGDYVLSFYRADGLDERDSNDKPVPSFTITVPHSALSANKGPANLASKLLPLFVALFYLVNRFLSPKK